MISSTLQGRYLSQECLANKKCAPCLLLLLVLYYFIFFKRERKKMTCVKGFGRIWEESGVEKKYDQNIVHEKT